MASKRKMRVTTKKLRKNRRRYSQRGGRPYASFPEYMPHNEYLLLDEEDKVFFTLYKFHKRIPAAEGYEILRQREANATASLRQREERIAQIRSGDVEITDQELKTLIPVEERATWLYSRMEGPQWDSTTYYRKQRLEDTLEYKAEHDPTIKLKQAQYDQIKNKVRKLPLGWIKTPVQVGMMEFEDLWRWKTEEDVEKERKQERESTLEWKVGHEEYFYLTDTEYLALPPNQRADLGLKRTTRTVYVDGEMKHIWARPGVFYKKNVF